MVTRKLQYLLLGNVRENDIAKICPRVKVKLSLRVPSRWFSSWWLAGLLSRPVGSFLWVFWSYPFLCVTVCCRHIPGYIPKSPTSTEMLMEQSRAWARWVFLGLALALSSLAQVVSCDLISGRFHCVKKQCYSKTLSVYDLKAFVVVPKKKKIIILHFYWKEWTVYPIHQKKIKWMLSVSLKVSWSFREEERRDWVGGYRTPNIEGCI